MKITYLLFSVAFALTLGVTGCEGDRGEVGPIGLQGGKGTKGDKGEQGDKGEVGEESLTFGNIEVTITGTTPEGEAYTTTVDFNHFDEQIGLCENSFYEGDPGQYYFRITRMHKSELANGRTNGGNVNSIQMWFAYENGEPIVDSQFSFSTHIIHELSYFEEYWNSHEEHTFAITNVSFDPETGKLKFDFTITYVDYSDNDVNITGSVDLFLLEKHKSCLRISFVALANRHLS